MVNREVYSKFKTAPTEEETGKVPAGVSGQKRNARELSMVTVLIDYLFTGACHAPVRSKQGEVGKVQTENCGWNVRRL